MEASNDILTELAKERVKGSGGVEDIETQDFSRALDKQRLEESVLSNKLRAEELKSREQDREQRREYADRIFSFLCIYMLGVFLVLIGSGVYWNDFHLNDEVLIALFTTTTANVLATFYFVARYLFNIHK